MRAYDIKRGHFSSLEGDGLQELMKKHFGNVRKEGEHWVSTYGAIRTLRVKLDGKTKLLAETEMNSNVDDKTAQETIKRYNQFLFEATGFTAKERKKRFSK